MLVLRLLQLSLLTFTLGAYADHRGGNGGDPSEIYLKNTSHALADFLDTDTSKTIYSRQEVDRAAFKAKVRETTWTIKEEELKDKFGNPRCALNFPDESKVFVNKKCMDNVIAKPLELYTLVLHEMFNLIGLELPNDRRESEYPLSSKISRVDLSLILSNTKAVFSTNCEIYFLGANGDRHSEDLFQAMVSFQVKNLLKSKGFKFVGFTSQQQERKSEFVLSTSFVLHNFKKEEVRRLDHETLYIGETPFLWTSKKDPNSVAQFDLYYFMFDPRAQHVFQAWHPARMTIERSGEQYSPKKVLELKSVLLNSLIALPSCLLYEDKTLTKAQ